MRKYTNKKPNRKIRRFNIFKRNERFKENIGLLSNRISRNEEDLKYLKMKTAKSELDFAEIERIESNLSNNKANLETLKENYSNFKKGMGKIAVVLGLSLTLLASFGVNKIEDRNFDSNIISAYDILELQKESPDNSNDVSMQLYESVKDDISRYVELNKKDDLSDTEKEESDNILKRLKSNPECITKLSLDILKQKIATSLGIDDYKRLKISDESTQLKADKYTPKSGKVESFSLYLDGKLVANSEFFTSIHDGQTYANSKQIPEEILQAIKKISASQKDEQNSAKAGSALRGVVKGLDDFNFSDEVKNNVQDVLNQKNNDKQLELEER